MTNPLYGSLQNLAQSLLTSYGQAVTIRRREKTHNPSTGIVTETVTDYTCSGVVAPFKAYRVDGTLIKANDLQLTVDAKSLTITPDETKDVAIVGGREYAIVRVVQTNPGGVALVHELQVRS